METTRMRALEAAVRSLIHHAERVDRLRSSDSLAWLTVFKGLRIAIAGGKAALRVKSTEAEALAQMGDGQPLETLREIKL